MNEDQLKEYAEELKARLDEAVYLKRAEVNIEKWEPEYNKCHHNVTIWCCNNPTYKPVRGWLFFSALNLLKSHSAVLTPDGELCDITPSMASAEYPFLPGNLSEEEYSSLVEGAGINDIYI
jgi:hypothetical protein